jgi:hypothetical protein
MFNIRTLLFTIFMVGSGMAPSSDAGAPEINEDQEDLLDFATADPTLHDDAPPPTRRGPGRPCKDSNAAVIPRASSRVRIAGTVPVARSTRSPARRNIDDPGLQTWMRTMERQMQQLMHLATGKSAAAKTSAASDPDPDNPDDGYSNDNSNTSQLSLSPRNRLPVSNLLPHIPHQSLSFWAAHPVGTPIPYKELPATLRSALGKNERDRLEAQHMFTALSISASLLDVLMAIGSRHAYAQLGAELIMNNLAPMLAPRTGCRDGNSGRQSSRGRGNQHRNSTGGSHGQRNNNCSNTNNGGRSNTTGGSSGRGSSRYRSDPRPRGTSRNGASARSTSAASAARGGDQA